MEVILSPFFLATEGTENTEHNDQMKKKKNPKKTARKKQKSISVDLPAVLLKNNWLPLRALRSLR
jgi:hypothetical protein